MRRADRLFEIIEILRQARGPISAGAIAADLEVCKRTIYRDIATLMAQRVPIQGEAGVGYVLDDGFHMPPLMLTSAEIEAAVLGAQWVAARGEPALAKAAGRLIAKIEAVAPAASQASFVEPATSVAPGATAPEALDASEMRTAIRQRRKIRIRYRGADGAQTDRTVWPIVLGYRDHGRILAAWCELRGGFRYFRTERIIKGIVLDDPLPKPMHALRKAWRAAMDAERDRLMARAAATGQLRPGDA